MVIRVNYKKTVILITNYKIFFVKHIIVVVVVVFVVVVVVVVFYLGFLSRTTLMVHRTAGEGGGYSFKSSLPLPPTSQTLRH